eukprot:gnl/TRDRNA2_/TRDRNA2_43060_c0_seq1.p1 gnl/TRDRNA2_/TRDRNA2_43060_c0~~gnl/TRDRNA2_/TRDRNA2_43060_c0_seq1.p1  ORF type:complete len:441 (+),score=47.64 gnl/TRDRNA2_/TRDRNA2_43060_c0_seq1:64-1386(+)
MSAMRFLCYLLCTACWPSVVVAIGDDVSFVQICLSSQRQHDLALDPRCESAGARFTEPYIVDLRRADVKQHLINKSERDAYMQKVLARAANYSYPVLIRGNDEFGPLQAKGFQIVQHLCSTSAMLTKMIKAYEAMSDHWGQMRETNDQEVKDLLALLPSDQQPHSPTEATMDHFVRLVHHYSAAMEAANLTHIQASKFFPDQHCPRLSKLLKVAGWEPSYWKLPGWKRMNRYLFVQPPGSAMAAHIDGQNSYFLLHVHRGRKRVRLWPVYSRPSPFGLEPPETGENEIENWVRAQQMWPDSVDPLVRMHACEGFGGTKNPCDPHSRAEGMKNGGMTERNFVHTHPWAADRLATQQAGAEGSLKLRYGRGAAAHQCFVEVELGAGDEIFVPSDTPHAVENLQPTLSTGINYRPETSFADKPVWQFTGQASGELPAKGSRSG